MPAESVENVVAEMDEALEDFAKRIAEAAKSAALRSVLGAVGINVGAPDIAPRKTYARKVEKVAAPRKAKAASKPVTTGGCSKCGKAGHNARTCGRAAAGAAAVTIESKPLIDQDRRDELAELSLLRIQHHTR